jgi:hypothetical protein
VISADLLALVSVQASMNSDFKQSIGKPEINSTSSRGRLAAALPLNTSWAGTFSTQSEFEVNSATMAELLLKNNFK